MELYPYQQLAVDRILNERNIALYLRPGLGKSIITLKALERIKFSHCLIVAPKRVASDVWRQEIEKWSINLTAQLITGSPSSRAAKYKQTYYQIDIISYSNLVWLATHTKLKKYDAIVFDELSYMKSPGAKRFRSIRSLLKNFNYRIGLTGTPCGNSLLGIWSQMYCIALDKPLGQRYTEFRGRWFQQVSDYVYRPWPDTQGYIQKQIDPYVFSEKNVHREEKLMFNPVTLHLSQKSRKIYDEFEDNMFIDLGENVTIESFNNVTLSNKLRQLSSGHVYDSERNCIPIHNVKLEYLKELVGELQGSPLLVFYQFLFEVHSIQANIPEARHIDDVSLDQWNAGEVPVMLAHPASAGHGLNLQYGGHNLCWYSLPWSLEQFGQANKRLDRPGQKSELVAAHIPLIDDTIDAVVFKSLQCNQKVEESLLEYVRQKNNWKSPVDST